jgi:peptide subunit release factor 1 (eRF1)
MVDAAQARILSFALGRLAQRDAIDGDTPRAHSRGGWSQLRLQHHRAEHVDKLQRGAAAALARVFDEERPRWVLLGGRHEAVARLERQLPERVAARAQRLAELAPDHPAGDLRGAVEAALDEAERAEEAQAIGAIETLARAGGRGALGLHQVVGVLNAARVQRVLAARTLRRTVRSCVACGTIDLGTSGTCPRCGEATAALDAQEAMARAAIALDARFDLVPNGLLEEHGAAALLRF